MHAVQFSRWAMALAASLALAGCATTGSPEGAQEVAAPAAAASEKTTVEPGAAAPNATTSDRSPLVQAGRDPAIAGPGVDIRKSPAGFTPLPEGLEERAEQRWKLLIAGDGEKAYDYLSAGVRSSLNRDTYANDMRSRPVRWVSADALDAQCEDTSCAVRVLMTIKFSMQSTGVKEMETQSAVTERWIRVGDEWFHIPDQYLEGFAK